MAADDWVFPGCPHAGPAIQTDADGRLHVAWYTGEEHRQGLWYAVSDDLGRSFGGNTPLLIDEWVPPSQVALTRSPSGMVVAWEDRTTEPAGIALHRIGRGGITGAASRIGTGRSPALHGDGATSLLVWLERDAIRAAWGGLPE